MIIWWTFVFIVCTVLYVWIVLNGSFEQWFPATIVYVLLLAYLILKYGNGILESANP